MHTSKTKSSQAMAHIERLKPCKSVPLTAESLTLRHLGAHTIWNVSEYAIQGQATEASRTVVPSLFVSRGPHRVRRAFDHLVHHPSRSGYNDVLYHTPYNAVCRGERDITCDVLRSMTEIQAVYEPQLLLFSIIASSVSKFSPCVVWIRCTLHASIIERSIYRPEYSTWKTCY
jgi:hypothetical protein